ncbi:MAG: hypothetical protein CVV13_10545 [Gammaproteobacteria bacterium HGW-Gammaproteobacteria-3]|nr:MAG: hypothetical protein CVV13_10545 [Gammaproteobacteria bacterium HGW-Gammaproteobacteria-3]
MKLAIMQPYFLPYIGYFQLIAAVDVFVVYDNIKYTKKGWINRNRMLLNGKDVMFSLPLERGSDSLHVCQRELAAEFNRDKLLDQISSAYRRAPYFAQTFPLIEQIIGLDERNLFQFIQYSILKVCEYLNITTKIKISSHIAIDHQLKSQDKVLALCEAIGTDMYINTTGGMALYTKEEFQARGINLKFIKPKPFGYGQLNSEFVPWLSIIDVMMFNPLDTIQDCIESNYELI